jgi:hypothetical protein
MGDVLTRVSGDQSIQNLLAEVEKLKADLNSAKVQDTK